MEEFLVALLVDFLEHPFNWLLLAMASAYIIKNEIRKSKDNSNNGNGMSM